MLTVEQTLQLLGQTLKHAYPRAFTPIFPTSLRNLEQIESIRAVLTLSGLSLSALTVLGLSSILFGSIMAYAELPTEHREQPILHVACGVIIGACCANLLTVLIYRTILYVIPWLGSGLTLADTGIIAHRQHDAVA